MTKLLRAKDLLPIPDLEQGDRDWLAELQGRLRIDEHVVRLGDAAVEHDPVVATDAQGVWRAGRYIGSITLGDRRLFIEPRFRHEILQHWLSAALNLVIVPRSTPLTESESFIPLLLGMIWCRELDTATRHGPPFLRIERLHQGLTIRGRLAVRETAALRRTGRRQVASISGERSLDNPIARTLVLAERALSKMIGSDRWLTDRAKEVMPHLWAAVGTRPRLPSQRELDRIRYSPIRRPFQGLVARSWRIAKRQGYTSAGGDGEAEGILLDVAELWERFVLHCARQAWPALEIEHGALGAGLGERRHLLLASDPRRPGLGLLLPDVIVRRGPETLGLIDAKYKLLANRADAPEGVARSDRYQIAGYVTALRTGSKTEGLLAYPAEIDEATGHPLPPESWRPSRAESDGPWFTSEGNRIQMQRLPVEAGACAESLREILPLNPVDTRLAAA